MELSKKSELTVGSVSYVIKTELASDTSPSIQTRVLGAEGAVVFQTSQDVSSLRPLFQNTQQVFSRLETQHQVVIKKLQEGQIPTNGDQGSGGFESLAGDETSEEPAFDNDSAFEIESTRFEPDTTTFEPETATAEPDVPTFETDPPTFEPETGTAEPDPPTFEPETGTFEPDPPTFEPDPPTFEPDPPALEPPPPTFEHKAPTFEPTTPTNFEPAPPSTAPPPSGGALQGPDAETRALEECLSLLSGGNFEKATAQLKALLQTHPSCSEARELLEVTYKASSGARLPVELVVSLKSGMEAFAAGRQRNAIESWKCCLIEEPSNRRLQLLVLLSTTWSVERRQHFANEVLSPGTNMKAGRPEETQALLLVAQTAENTQAMPAAPQVAPPPPVMPAPTPPPVPHAAVTPQTILTDRDSSESLMADASSVVVINDDEPTPPSTYPPSTGPSQTARQPPSVDYAQDQDEPSLTPPRTGEHRRPMGRAKQRSVPWALISGVAAAILLVAGGLFWLLSGENTVPPQRLEEAARFVGAGQYEKAIAAYDTLLEEYGDHPEMYKERGRAKVASSDVEGGLADLKRAHSLSTESSAIAEEIGDVYYSRGNISEAIDFYEEAFDGYVGSADSRYRFAVALVERGDGDAALEHLGAAIKGNPRHGEALFLYGQLLNERGRFDAAERALRDSKGNTDAGADYPAQLIIALIGQEKLDEAEEVARRFIRSYPTSAQAHALLGEVYLNRKQYEPARAQLIRALRTDPNLPRAQIALGRAWLAIGRSRGDVRDLAKARQVLAEAKNVHEGERLMALGQVALAEGDLDAAEGLLRQSLEEGAEALPVYLSLAESRARGEDLVGAAEELQRASGLAPDDAAITLSLAIAYAQFEDVDRAASHFLKTIQAIGLVTPASEDEGPILLPTPYIPLPEEFDVNQTIRDAYEGVLELREDDPAAIELQTLAESTTFMFR